MRLFRDIEMPLVLVLAEMELAGVCIDVGFLKNKSKEFEGQLARLQQKIYDAAGAVFNINSPKQLSAILFEKLGLPVQRRTKTGPSTDISVLEKLSTIHELPKLLLEYRSLAKLKSTYIDALPELVNPATKRIHTSFNQTVTTTGRLSSSNPNLQNIPVRTEEGKKIRRAFIPPDEGWKLISADYSQIELRIFAHLADEKEMIKAFQEGEDIHSYTASLIHDVPLEEVNDEMRYRAKAVNFGLIYGQQAYGLSNYLKISVSEAQRFIDQYLERYPNVRSFMDETIEGARERGYVTTLFGRRRYVPELKSSSRQTQQLGERIAINTPIQGSAADIIKIAMIKIPPRLRESSLRSQMILQIHDELLCEAPEDEIDEVERIVVEKMESVVELSAPLKVDIRVGENWKDV
jgi:DNA polymerase-1